MKYLQPLILFLLLSNYTFSQNKRIKPPKKSSKITSVDAFVNNTFSIYHKVFVYDSLTSANVEVPSELEDALVESVERELDSLWTILPDVFEDITDGDASILKKSRATLNLNKTKKALKYCLVTTKNYFLGSKEEEDKN